jgi:leader peptidase (prepilin peptidase)/N-methyltransferase
MTFFYFFTFIIGLCLGSFINALVYRLYEELPFVKARSLCPKCKKQLAWSDNIPLLSFIFLRGKCHYCHEKISWQYPIIEFVTGILFVFIAFLTIQQFSNSAIVPLFHCSIVILYSWFVVSALITIFLFDLKYSLIPDIISLPAIAVVLIAKILFLLPHFSIVSFKFLCFSAIIGGSWFALQYFLSKGKWVGGGDIRLGVLMGLILPWPHVLTALFLSYIGGALAAAPLLLFKKKTMKSEIPFGVFLVPATLVAMFWGEKIVGWYFNLF